MPAASGDAVTAPAPAPGTPRPPAGGAGRICLALDSGDHAAIEDLVGVAEGAVGVFKLGLSGLASHGPECVRALAARRPVLVVLKLQVVTAQV